MTHPQLVDSQAIGRGAQLSDECLRYFGLSRQPFADAAPLSFIYTDAVLDMAVNVVVDYLAKRNAVLVLKGEAGMGKTTQLRLLVQRSQQRYQFCVLDGAAGLTWGALEAQMRRRWPLGAQPLVEPPLGLAERMVEVLAQAMPAVLVVDDADKVDRATLERLLALKRAVDARAARSMGLVLTGEPRLQITLAALEGRDTPEVVSVNLRPYTQAQTRAYVAHRLSAAGRAQAVPLDEAQTNAVHRDGAGLPAGINRAAASLLERTHFAAHPQRRSYPRHKAPVWPLNYLFVLGLTLLAGLAASLDIDPRPPAASPAPALAAGSPDWPPPAPGLGQGRLARAEPSTEAAALITEAEPSPAKAANAAASPAPRTSLKTPAWLLQQDPNAFSIQVLAVNRRQGLVDFAKRQPLPFQSAYYTRIENDRSWHILLTGLFTSPAAAERAISELPPQVRAARPWVRRLERVQRVIRRASRAP